jgi:transcriptional regulator with XRE-family HTH domain
MDTISLLDTTVTLLRDRGRYREVAEATGLGYDWINKLVQGQIKDPGVNKIERLHKYLSDESTRAA